MADYSTYLKIDGDDHEVSGDSTFVYEQHAIYDSCTNYFGAPSATPAEAMRQVESLQRKSAATTVNSPSGKSSLNDRTPLLAGASRKSLATKTSVDSVYEPKKSKKVDVWFSMFFMFYVFYLVLGSMAFAQMEMGNELAERQDFREVRQRFMQKYSDILGSAELDLNGGSVS